MTASLLSIGDELVLGQTVDTNAAWIAQRLAEIGIRCKRHLTVADETQSIADAIRSAARDSQWIIVTGGLGPTADDLTRDALAAVLGTPLEMHEPSLRQIETYFHTRRRTMHESNRSQAMIPVGAEPIENICGTAPGMHTRIGRAELFSLPGVPSEMRAMFERSVLPRLRASRAAGTVILQHTLRSFGMSESELGDRIRELMARGRNPSVGTSASDMIISIKINALFPTIDAAREAINADRAVIRDRLGDVVFGEGDDTLQDALARLLTADRLTIATAESCTGGLIAKCLTDVPGSSAYFLQGYITYSNESKSRLLGIPESMTIQHGAVSHEIAGAMATAARQLAGADYALSATGIAGPTGGSADKPVGLVFIGLAGPNGVDVRELRLGDNLTRRQIRDRSTKAALNLTRLTLLHSGRQP